MPSSVAKLTVEQEAFKRVQDGKRPSLGEATNYLPTTSPIAQSTTFYFLNAFIILYSTNDKVPGRPIRSTTSKRWWPGLEEGWVYQLVGHRLIMSDTAVNSREKQT